MITMDIRHPDILDFIKVKRDLTKVTGANISVKLNSEFMIAVKNDEQYPLRFPVEAPLHEATVVNYVRAKDIWDEIVSSAHMSAEPGIMFWDTMIDYAPDGVYDKHRPISTNPCGSI